MFKLLVLSCLLVCCLADSFSPPPRLREVARRPRPPWGCANRAEGRRACAALENGEALAPHSRDCRLYFFCKGKGRPVCRMCPRGLLFNPQLQRCDWPKNVNCTTRPHHNRTTPYPTTPSDDTTVTVIDGSGTTDNCTNEATTTDAIITTTDATTTDATTTDATISDATTTAATTTLQLM